MSQYLPNFTQIPNVIIDDVMPLLSDTEYRVLTVIARQTYGWILDPGTGRRKDKDWISYSQLREKTGRYNTSLAKAIRSLESKNLIEVLTENGKRLESKNRLGQKLFYRIVTSTSPESGDHLSTKWSPESGDTKETCTKDIEEEDTTYSKASLPTPRHNLKTKKGEFSSKLLETPHSNPKRLNGLEIWEISLRKNVNHEYVLDIYRQVLESIRNGDKYKVKDIGRTVSKWTDMHITEDTRRGRDPHMSPEERMVEESFSPQHSLRVLKELEELQKNEK